MDKLALKRSLLGLTVELVDEVLSERLTFGEMHVAATIGTREAVCAPILQWEVMDGDSAVIHGSGFEIRWSEIQVQESVIGLFRNGEAKRYRILERRRQPTRSLPG